MGLIQSQEDQLQFVRFTLATSVHSEWVKLKNETSVYKHEVFE